ncbi:MAG: hypothetical protein ACXACR_14610 [Candidatus Hodarchaeales archaeon]|jgi:hypothetical protein
MNITERFAEMNRNELKIAHFNSADVINNPRGNHIVLYSSNGSDIDVIFYETSEDYVNQDGVILKTMGSYSEALQLAQLILKE